MIQVGVNLPMIQADKHGRPHPAGIRLGHAQVCIVLDHCKYLSSLTEQGLPVAHTWMNTAVGIRNPVMQDSH
jgi:hypothetical protein